MKKHNFGQYKIKKTLGSGGNGTVFLVENANGVKFALKKYNESITNSTKAKRFLDEIKIMKNNKNIPGVIPIIASSLLDLWYVMPLAESIKDYKGRIALDLEGIIKGISEIAETLVVLHSRKIAHRDIKPENILYYQNRFYLADFGIAKTADSDNITKKKDRMGATFTMAPEVYIDSRSVDFYKADVYSLAKTLWLLVADEGKMFVSDYDFRNPDCTLRYLPLCQKEYTSDLELLLQQSINSNIEHRPQMDKFKKVLDNWLENKRIEREYNDIDYFQESQWKFLSTLLFNEPEPSGAKWTKLDKIIEVLNTITQQRIFNHMFMPSGGGNDLTKVIKSNEKDCIELLFENNSQPYIVKPKTLYFESFDKDFKWNYFLLECITHTPVFPDKAPNDFYETLTEDYPSHYVDSTNFIYGVYDYDQGNKLPPNSRLVTRFFNGNFLLTLKTGPYNRIANVYDGRHNDCRPSFFRNYIEQMLMIYNKFYETISKDSRFSKLTNKKN